jgi:hypothetical protein
MVLGLLDPDPYLFCADPNPAPFNKQKKLITLISEVTFYDFLSLKIDVNVGYLQKVISKTNWEKTYFLLAFWKSMTKRAGSGSVNKVYGSKAPDP